MEVDGHPIDLGAGVDRAHPLFDRHEYQVALRKSAVPTRG
jgi:hypothetical protein